MKSTKVLFVVFICLIFILPIASAQSSGTLNLSSIQLMYVNPPAYSDGYYDDIQTISVPKNTPIKITFSHNTNNQFVIYTSTNTYVNTFSSVSNAIVTVVSSDGFINVKSSYDWAYFPFFDEGFFIYNLTYEVDNSYTTNNNLFTQNNAIVNGKLGVGTNSPSKKLEIWEGLGGRFTFSAISCTSGYEVAQTIDNTGYKINIGSSIRNYKIAINSSDRLKLLSGENTAIGTYAINSSSTGTNNTAIGMYALGSNTTGSYNIAMGYNSLQFNTSGSNNVALGNNAGRFISTNSSNTSALNSIFIGDNTKSQFTGQVNQIVIGSNATGNGDHTVTLGNDGILKTFLKGNIGISTSMPKVKLHIGSDINWDIPTLGTSSGNVFFAGENDLYGLYGGCSVNGNYWFQAMRNDGNTTPYSILLNPSGGSVGIGTKSTDPTGALLSVNGTIHAKEVIIDMNGLADYVFNNDYKLLPLKQVESFVKENNHLPDMPSAKEVKDKGLTVGDMQNKLLQKIEELTLYIIEQQNVILKQGVMIEVLSKKIN